MTATRRLAAIAVADVVGYSRLMESDEAGTLAALKQRRKTIVEPVIRTHGGRIVKVMGDGVLIEFASAVNAVKAAMEVQGKMAEANGALPEERRIVLRIGINLGDVVGEGSDIYGDGVNVAARLEALAGPSGICISGKVREEVHGKIAAAFEDLGERTLKNIARPVHIYEVRQPAAHAPGGPTPTTLPDRPAIAVLPFANLSSDPEQQYFSDGITKDIVTELTRFRQMRVVVVASSFRYRGLDLDPVRVGRELGARYLVEGSVRRLGERIRVTVQLVDAGTGHHLWAEKFDRGQDEIFAVQDEVVHTIAATLFGRLKAADVEGSRRKPPSSLSAYECVLRADALPFGDPDAAAEARRLFEKAIEIDPCYSRAYAGLANSLRLEWSRDMSGASNVLEQALALAKTAVQLDDNDSLCQQDLGWVYMQLRRYDLAEHHFLKALELNANQPSALTSLGILRAYLGYPQEGLDAFKAARRLDPLFNPSWYWRMLGIVQFIARQYDDAIAAFSRSPQLPDWVHAYLAACHVFMDRPGEAQRHVAESLRLTPRFSRIQTVAKDPFARESDREHLLEGMRKAGLPE